MFLRIKDIKVHFSVSRTFWDSSFGFHYDVFFFTGKWERIDLAYLLRRILKKAGTLQ